MIEADPVWVFDLGDGPAEWPWDVQPDVRLMGRVRPPRSGARSRHVPVWAYSATTGGHLHLESGLEHDLLRELDRRHDVFWLVSQPCRIQLPLQRRRRRLSHTPDLLSIDGHGQVTIWDVRAETKQDDEFRLKAEHTRRACEQVGWGYAVFTGLPAARRLNLLWLHGYRRPMPWYEGALRDLAGPTGWPGTIGDVLAADEGTGHLTSALWHGIWTGQVVCDLDQVLTATTRIALCDVDWTGR